MFVFSSYVHATAYNANKAIWSEKLNEASIQQQQVHK